MNISTVLGLYLVPFMEIHGHLIKSSESIYIYLFISSTSISFIIVNGPI